MRFHPGLEPAQQFYEVAPDRQDAWLWGLGVATRDQVIVRRQRSGALCVYTSVQQIMDRWGRRRELRLLWAAGGAPKWTVEPGDDPDGESDHGANGA
ncbi:hypothetical protein [Goodfellowiella coeruleoviolacea]|uniref:Uncharacterized protein n=1 Tax=Goodfellowiella coeruleoviolacea TaxID=334858 RepID=A0AAE3KIR1_9PSEU|nr:hypothetical protein [Goodfellowiella coeruleoviolacea]MCP2168262.1 hypothetical protein [Goodfellowiella coeruleoviolacea]